MSQLRSAPHGNLRVYAQRYSRHPLNGNTAGIQSIKVPGKEIIYTSGAKPVPRGSKAFRLKVQAQSWKTVNTGQWAARSTRKTLASGQRAAWAPLGSRKP